MATSNGSDGCVPSPNGVSPASTPAYASFHPDDLLDGDDLSGQVWDGMPQALLDFIDKLDPPTAEPAPTPSPAPTPVPLPRDASGVPPASTDANPLFPGQEFLVPAPPNATPAVVPPCPPPVTTSPEIPIDLFTAPNDANATDAGNFARLVQWNADKLVVALNPAAGAEVEVDIYGIDERGMLSAAEFHAAVLATGRRYILEAYNSNGDSKKEFLPQAAHARQLRDAKATKKLRAVAAGVIAELRAHKALPPGLVVKTKADIDADLSVIGTPSGVLDLRTGEILPPVEAREFFVLSNTGVEYDPSAQHERIDQILPPVATLVDDTPAYYRARIVAFGMCHRPQREFMWEVCDEASGKSSFVNALKQGLGSSYIRTIRKEALQMPKYLHGATAHNGDLRHFRAPSRFVFGMEWSSSYDPPLVKSLSGGDTVTMRRIAMEDEEFQPTGHLWLMGNSGENADAALGISGEGADARAIRDRAKLLTRTRIPNAKQVKTVVELSSPDFKKAALARVIEYCMTFGHLAFPNGISSFATLLDQQAQAETPLWKRQWLPNVLEAVPPPGAGVVPPSQLGALNKEVYEAFRAWFDQFGEGEIPSPKAVGGAVVAHYQMQPPQKTTVVDPASNFVKWITAYRYCGWQLRG